MKNNVPGFNAHESLLESSIVPQGITRRKTTVENEITPQFRCALHAIMCLAMSEELPVAALCWMRFVEKCGGAMA